METRPAFERLVYKAAESDSIGREESLARKKAPLDGASVKAVSARGKDWNESESTSVNARGLYPAKTQDPAWRSCCHETTQRISSVHSREPETRIALGEVIRTTQPLSI